MKKWEGDVSPRGPDELKNLHVSDNSFAVLGSKQGSVESI